MPKPKVLFRGRVFSVTGDRALEPGGIRAIREIVRHPGSAVIIPQRDDGRVLLVRQFRFSFREFLWEAVAGRVDTGESPLQAAQRELAEEARLGAGRWIPLGLFYPSPGFMDERMWLFLARGLRRASAPPDPDERIRKRWFQPRELRDLVRRGRIRDGKTVLSYFLLEDGGYFRKLRPA